MGIDDIEVHIANLPDPTKDPMPPGVGELSPEELKAIRQDKRKRSRRSWSGAAEAMVKRILESPNCFNVKGLTKKDDRLQEVVGKDGKVRRFYANWKHPDFKFGAVDVDDRIKTGYCEVKSCSPKSSGINLYLRNTEGQIKFMEKLNGTYIKWWALVFWEDVGQARVFMAPHDRFMRIRDHELYMRAKEDKRFGGKSLRREKDLDLLADCEVVKIKGKWALPPNHWYNAGQRLHLHS